LGLAYYSLDKYDTAIKFQLQSLAIAQEIKDRRGEEQSLGNLGLAYYSLGKYDQAIGAYLQSLEIKRQIKDRDGEAISFNNLGVTFKKLRQPELAILFYKQSVSVREAIRIDIRKLSKEEQRSYLETVNGSYKRLAELLLKQNRIMEALQVLDLLKIQELEDYFKNIKGSDRSAQGVRLLEPEKTIADKLLAVSFDNSKEINSQLANQIQQLPKSEINKVPDYLQQIPERTVLLYPLILSDRIEIILFSPKSLPISRTIKVSQKELENRHWFRTVSETR
jgi:tetratricopeptide (TPR) repeat protein